MTGNTTNVALVMVNLAKTFALFVKSVKPTISAPILRHTEAKVPFVVRDAA